MLPPNMLSFVKRSASIGMDQGQVPDYRDNVIDTLNDEGMGEWVSEALAVFDKEVSAHLDQLV